jgi:amino acid permease
MEAPAEPALQAQTLKRELGRWDLTAIGVNQVIGGAIFLMPSQVAAQIGPWSVLAFVLVGAASLLVALCFAEVGSRFEGTGGPYLYTRAAFGRFAGFEVGFLQWFARVTSHSSIVNGVALALAFYWPAVASGPGRSAVIIGLTLALTAINPAKRMGSKPAHHWQASAAGDLHRRRRLFLPFGQRRLARARHMASGDDGRVVDDLRVRRLRCGARSRRRSE